MEAIEQVEQEIYDNNIDIIPFDFETIDGVIVKNKEKYAIGIKKGITGIKRRDILEHELAHVRTSSLYNFDSSKQTMKRREYKANYEVITKCIDPNELLLLLQKGYKLYELSEHFELGEDTIKEAIRIYRNKGMI